MGWDLVKSRLSQPVGSCVTLSEAKSSAVSFLGVPPVDTLTLTALLVVILGAETDHPKEEELDGTEEEGP